MKRILCIILSLIIILTSTVSTPVTDTHAADSSKALTGKTAMQIVKQMGLGWNLGNTFDATGKSTATNIYAHETSWGNPKVTKTLIKGVKALGFNTIRIPVTWYTELDSNYTIKKEYLARVKQVVDMAIDQGMFVILNVHHENWINTASLSTNKVKIGKELAAIWKQLANTFASYDQHLIFEGMNEPRYAGASNEWTGNEAGYKAVNYLNQIFVSTIRSSKKGYNQERCLMIPQYAASNSSSILNYWEYPKVNGKKAKNIIVSVHCYSPYNFCLSDKQKTWSAKNASDTSEINSMFEYLNKTFIANNIPVVIGETSATNSGNNTSARAAWAKYMGQMSKSYGVPIVIWDNGYNGTSGGECHAWINRTTGKANSAYKTVITSLVNGYKSKTYGSARKDASSKLKSLVGATTVLWQNKNGLKVNAWNNSFVSLTSYPSYYVKNHDLVVVYTGDQGVGLVIDSATYEKWWIWVEADKVVTKNGKKVAYFSKATIDSALKKEGITGYAGLRNIAVVTKGTEMVYEFSMM